MKIYYQFSQNEIEVLEQYRNNQENPRIRNRFYALLMIARGISPELAASVTGVSTYTINYWLKLYIEEGIDRLNTFSYAQTAVSEFFSD